MTNEEIYRAALEKFGVEAQCMKAVEECAEFLNALAKFKGGRATVDELIDEIADVTIMMEQMALVFGYDATKLQKSFKVNRLKQRLGLE